MAKQYQHTGKQIPVSVPDLISFVHDKLYQYDQLKKGTGVEPTFNPYLQPIIYTMSNGKSIIIPENIQKQAVGLWIKKKHDPEIMNNSNNQNIPNQEDSIPAVQEIGDVIQYGQPKQKPNKIIYVFDNNTNSWLMIGLILLLIYCFYIYFVSDNNPSDMYVGSPSRFYTPGMRFIASPRDRFVIY